MRLRRHPVVEPDATEQFDSIRRYAITGEKTTTDPWILGYLFDCFLSLYLAERSTNVFHQILENSATQVPFPSQSRLATPNYLSKSL